MGYKLVIYYFKRISSYIVLVLVDIIVSGGATFNLGCSQEHPELKKKKKYIYIYNN